jgi:3-hydroxyisobutyrate dehydrogenase-like beta-hydroxyacid dehydrogenase
MKTAFLGLGIMGYPMAGHLSKQFETLVWNRTNTKTESHSITYGTKTISSFAELASVEVLFTCFPTSKEVATLPAPGNYIECSRLKECFTWTRPSVGAWLEQSMENSR